MKTRILALTLVLALMLSCVFALSSCKKNKKDPTLNLDENISENEGSGDVTVITDPNNPEAGADVEDKYVHG